MVIAFCFFATSKAILTKCIDNDEVGKAFSGISIVASAIPFFSAPSKFIDTYEEKLKIVIFFQFIEKCMLLMWTHSLEL